MRVLITGIAGFAGSHLAEALVAPPGDPLPQTDRDLEVHGTLHRQDRRIHHLSDRLTLHRGDLRNALWVTELIEEVMPDVVLHLAAWSDVGGSWRQPWTVYELNIQCQLNLLEALRRRRPDARTVIVTSNEVYGLVRPSDCPLDESTPFRPNSP
ncbi:MAG: GDP-mannose 4,6-dehydratase, partial [Caldilineaceae bacterium]